MTAQTAGEIMSEEVLTVGPEAPVSEVADIMTSKRVQAVPVVDGRRVVGIIGRIDLVRTMIG